MDSTPEDESRWLSCLFSSVFHMSQRLEVGISIILLVDQGNLYLVLAKLIKRSCSYIYGIPVVLNVFHSFFFSHICLNVLFMSLSYLCYDLLQVWNSEYMLAHALFWVTDHILFIILCLREIHPLCFSQPSYSFKTIPQPFPSSDWHCSYLAPLIPATITHLQWPSFPWPNSFIHWFSQPNWFKKIPCTLYLA